LLIKTSVSKFWSKFIWTNLVCDVPLVPKLYIT